MALQAHIKPIVYGIFNVGVGCGIVFANKAVLSVFNFKFVYCLTLIHTIVTMVGNVDVCSRRHLRDQEIYSPTGVLPSICHRCLH